MPYFPMGHIMLYLNNVILRSGFFMKQKSMAVALGRWPFF